MACFISIFLITIVFVFIDLIPLYKERQWMSLWVYTTMLVLIFLIAVLMVLDIKIPSPSGPLKKIITTIWGL